MADIITCPECKGRGWFIDNGPVGERFDCSDCEGVGTWEGLVEPMDAILSAYMGSVRDSSWFDRAAGDRRAA